MKSVVFCLLMFYTLCSYVAAQTITTTEEVIEFKKIKTGKLSYCRSGDAIRFNTFFSDTTLTAKIKEIHADSLIVLEIIKKDHNEIRQYNLNEIKSIGKETIMYKTAITTTAFCFVIGSACFFPNSEDNFSTYTFGAECFAAGAIIAIPVIALHKYYKLNENYYARIDCVNGNFKEYKKANRLKTT